MDDEDVLKDYSITFFDLWDRPILVHELFAFNEEDAYAFSIANIFALQKEIKPDQVYSHQIRCFGEYKEAPYNKDFSKVEKGYADGQL